MDLTRILRHVRHTRWAVRRAFPGDVLDAIERAVAAGERQHAGEVRCIIEGELSWEALLAGQTPRERALELFSLDRIWDTEFNSGVLVYILMADRHVEIVADRGYNGRVSAAEWRAVCESMERRFGTGQFGPGVVDGVAAVHALIGGVFPRRPGDSNELADRPATL